VVEQAIAGTLAPTAVELFKDLNAAREIAFGTSYEHPERLDLEVVRAYLEPCFGTLERARRFERILAALDPDDLKAIEPQLRALTVPTLGVCGTGELSFDVSWAYWLRDTIPGVTAWSPSRAPGCSSPRSGRRTSWPRSSSTGPPTISRAAADGAGPAGRRAAAS
jgi:hypothetical protein